MKKRCSFLALAVFALALSNISYSKVSHVQSNPRVAPASCTVSSLSRGSLWSPADVRTISYSGIKLGDDIVRTADRFKISPRPRLQNFTVDSTLFPDGRGIVPWIRSFSVPVNGVFSGRDMVFSLGTRGKYSLNTPVPSALVYRTLSSNGKGGMVVGAIRGISSIPNADRLKSEVVKRFGTPSFSYSTSGDCGNAEYLIYGSEGVLANGWSFEHYYRCVAAGGPANMPSFNCSLSNAPRQPWFGFKIQNGNVVSVIQDGSMGFKARYHGNYKKSAFPREN